MNYYYFSTNMILNRQATPDVTIRLFACLRISAKDFEHLLELQEGLAGKFLDLLMKQDIRLQFIEEIIREFTTTAQLDGGNESQGENSIKADRNTHDGK